jgi:hypothetical protein
MASDLEMITDEEQISLIVLREEVVASIKVACTARVIPAKTCKRTANNLLGFEPGTSKYKPRAVALACCDLYSDVTK